MRVASKEPVRKTQGYSVKYVTPDGMTFSAGELTFEGAYVADGETVIVGVLNANGNLDGFINVRQVQ